MSLLDHGYLVFVSLTIKVSAIIIIVIMINLLYMDYGQIGITTVGPNTVTTEQ